jgi:hypothetical protein
MMELGTDTVEFSRYLCQEECPWDDDNKPVWPAWAVGAFAGV